LLRSGYESLEVRSLLTVDAMSAWHNPGNPADVNDDGHVVPLDALLVINDLNVYGARAVPAAEPVALRALADDAPDAFLDVNNDLMVTPLDALLIINALHDDPTDLGLIRLQVTDVGGNVISSFRVGTDYFLEAFTQDLRDNGQGVSAAYLDVTYEGNLTAVDPGPPTAQVTFGPDFPSSQVQGIGNGIFNETGAFAGFATTGTDEVLLWRVLMQGNALGTVNFVPDPADDQVAHGFLLRGINNVIPTDDVDLHGASVQIVSGAVPAVTITDVTVNEGASGTTSAVFNVTLSANPEVTATVAFATVNNTTSNNDLNHTSGALTFSPGGSLTQQITVAVRGDTTVENTESFFVNLIGATNATLGDNQGVGTITNDDTPSLSISDAVAAEGGAGAVFQVTLTAGATQTVTVRFATADGTAVAPGDYTANTGTLTFNPGTTQQAITVAIVNDTDVEPSETFTVNLSDAQNATINDGLGSGTITDNDSQTPTLSIGDVQINEGDSGSVDLIFGVTLSNASAQNVVVAFNTQDGTAAAGSDYTSNSGNLTFTPGVVVQNVTVPIIGDTRDEINETFQVLLSNPTGANLADGQATGTIIDNDNPPSVSIAAAVSQQEGNSGTVQGLLNVTLSAVSGQVITVPFATSDGTATAGNDYVAQTATLTFQPGEQSKTITIAINGDTATEPDETVNVTLSQPTNATLGTAQGVLTIVNDDLGQPVLSINDVTVIEGNSGVTNAVFNVSVAGNVTSNVTVVVGTTSGTATAGSDFNSLSSTLTFTPGGSTTQAVTVQVIGDTVPEGNENFTVGLTSPTGATIGDGTGQGTITNDDTGPSLSINDVTVTEGNAGTVSAVFTVTLSAAATSQVTVVFATGNATATGGQDFVSQNGTLTFAPGTTTQSVTVAVNGDVVDESNETYQVNLTSPSGATISDAQGIGTIIDDDATPTLNVANVTVTEGNSGTVNAVFNVTLSAASGQQVTVQFATANGSAVAPGDFANNSGTLTFAPGTTTQSVTVAVNGDTTSEANETFTLNLSNPVNAVLATGTATGTITDDDTSRSLSINDVTVTEGNLGSVNAVFTVTLGGPAPAGNVTVQFATANSTATAGTDFTAANGTLTFDASNTTRTITVAVTGDTLDEANETFQVNLSNASAGVSLADGQGIGTITDDDGAPTISIADVSQFEGNSGTTNFVFNVSLSNSSGQQVTVNFATANGTATAGQDYTANTGTVTFAAGTTTRTVTVTVTGDTTVEANETFNVNLSNPVNATIADTQAVGTITNDDGTPTLAINDVTVTEGNSGTVNAVFTVTLGGGAASQPVTVVFNTSNNTATAGQDYTVASGTLTFNPGTTTQQVTVAVTGDTQNEVNETFNVTLSNPTGGATLADSQGVGTITNDDAVPTLSIADVAVTEGNAGTVNAVFNVTLSAASGQTVRVNFATANGTAVAGSDYVASSGTLTFNPGTTSQQITVVVNGDTFTEADQTFRVNLSNPLLATILDGEGVGTITNDDAAGNPEPSSISGVVFLDRDNDGIRDSGESAVANVSLRITGQSTTGTAVDTTVVTDANGAYTFANLAAGTYTVTETTPSGHIDGKDSVGTQGGTAPASDRFQITLGQSVDGANNNFGERLPTLEYFSKRNYLNYTIEDGSGGGGAQLQALAFDAARLAAEDGTSADGTVTRDGNTVTIRGTAGDDLLEFEAGDLHVVRVNGEEYVFAAGEVTNFLFDGGAGSDSATLVGSAADDFANVGVGTGSLVSAAYSVTVVNTHSISLDGAGGNNAADLVDSAFDDRLEAAGSGLSVGHDDFETFLEGFASIVARSANGGSDTALRGAIDFNLRLEGPWLDG
jgi:ribosomal protein L35AE/L33A